MNYTFHAVKKGELFEMGGNLWKKRSSKTAEIVASRTGATIHHDYAGKWFHFSNHAWINQDAVFWNLFYKENIIPF